MHVPMVGESSDAITVDGVGYSPNEHGILKVPEELASLFTQAASFERVRSAMYLQSPGGLVFKVTVSDDGAMDATEVSR